MPGSHDPDGVAHRIAAVPTRPPIVQAAGGSWWASRRAALPLVALRVVQFCLDLGLLTLLCLIPMSVTLLLPHNPDGTLGALLVSIPVVLLALLACVAVSWWYWAWWPARHDGRTFAMRWLHLRVVAADGSPVGASLMALRWIMLLVDGLLFGLVGLLAMLGTPRTQRLGDVVADTIVVRPTSGLRTTSGGVRTSSGRESAATERQSGRSLTRRARTRPRP